MYSWQPQTEDPMMIDIRKDGKLLFTLFLGEAMEYAGRERVMKHVAECDKTPWLRKWHSKTNTINKDGLVVNSNGDIDDARDADFDDLGMGN
jgi:hypothetical protein